MSTVAKENISHVKRIMSSRGAFKPFADTVFLQSTFTPVLASGVANNFAKARFFVPPECDKTSEIVRTFFSITNPNGEDWNDLSLTQTLFKKTALSGTTLTDGTYNSINESDISPSTVVAMQNNTLTLTDIDASLFYYVESSQQQNPTAFADHSLDAMDVVDCLMEFNTGPLGADIHPTLSIGIELQRKKG